MSTLTYHRKPNGTTYVYHQESYWDKERKRSATRQTCIGKLDGEGSIIYNKRFSSPEARVALERRETVTESVCTGHTLVIGAAAEQVGLLKVVRASFPKDISDQLLSLAYAVVALDGKIYHAQVWMEQNACPCHDAPVTSQAASRLLGGKLTSAAIEGFLARWMALRQQGAAEQYCYDITSVSSHNASNPFVEWGYNRDKEKMAQVNIALMSGATSQIPTFYEILPGSLTDVRTIGELSAHLKKLGAGRLDFLLDRGFYSKANVEQLLAEHHGFTIPLPTNITAGRTAIDDVRDLIEAPENVIHTDEDRTCALYGATRLSKINGKRVWYHVYLDTAARTSHILSLFDNLERWERELKEGRRVEEHEEAYARYFHVKTTPKRGLSVKRNQETIDTYKRDYAGFWVLLTNRQKDAARALESYRRRGSVECCFNDMKNELDMGRLRTHNANTMTGRVFVQFLALIILEQIRNVLEANAKKLSRRYSVSEVMLRLGSYRETTFSGRYGTVVSTPTLAQRELFAAFGIDIR